MVFEDPPPSLPEKPRLTNPKGFGGYIAQSVEQSAFNQLAVGSSPTIPITFIHVPFPKNLFLEGARNQLTFCPSPSPSKKHPCSLLKKHPFFELGTKSIWGRKATMSFHFPHEFTRFS